MNEDSLKVGVGRQAITPPIGSLLVGYADPNRFAESIRDPLNATAMVFEQGPTRAAIIAIDWATVEEPEVDAIRARVHERAGISPQNVTICASHTHSGPATINARGWGEKDRKYIDSAVPIIAEAAARAAKSVAPARMRIGSTESLVGINRREILKDHSITLGVNPWGPFDPTMTVLRFEGAAGPIATIVHYGAHPTSMDSKTRIVTRDWPGVMADRVEKLAGGTVLFLNGALGDVGPRIASKGTVGDSESAMLEVGLRAATDVMRAIGNAVDMPRADLSIITEPITLPLAPLPALEVARQKLTDALPNKDKWGPGIAEYTYWKSVVEAHGQRVSNSRAFGQTLTRIGPAVIVPIPGEAFAEIVLRIRRASLHRPTLPVSVSNGSMGYFVTREARARGGYEVWVAYAFGTRLPADNIDDALVSENLALLRKL